MSNSDWVSGYLQSPKQCEHCGQDIPPCQYGLSRTLKLRYCSKKCSNSARTYWPRPRKSGITVSYKEDSEEYLRQWRELNPGFRQRQYITASQRRLQIRAWFNDLKSRLACQRCGETHPACLDFHHKNPEIKNDNVSEMVNQATSKIKILNEIAKCEVLCSNCHRKEHWNEKHVIELAS